MENENKENKENIILTDEELKKVAGGIQCLPMSSGDQCAKKVIPLECMKAKECTWNGVKCITKSKS